MANNNFPQPLGSLIRQRLMWVNQNTSDESEVENESQEQITPNEVLLFYGIKPKLE